MKVIGKTTDGFILEAPRKEVFSLTGVDEGGVSLEVGKDVPIGHIVKKQDIEKIKSILES